MNAKEWIVDALEEQMPLIVASGLDVQLVLFDRQELQSIPEQVSVLLKGE